MYVYRGFSFLLFVISSLELEVVPVRDLAGHSSSVICALRIEERSLRSDERGPMIAAFTVVFHQLTSSLSYLLDAAVGQTDVIYHNMTGVSYRNKGR